MKTNLISAIILLCATTVSFAGGIKNTPATLTSKNVSLSNAFTKVTIGQNIHVIFQDASIDHATIEGNVKFVEGVNLVIDNGTLNVSVKNNFRNFTGTIFIPVSNLHQVDVKNNAKVYSEGTLKCKHLTVNVGDGAYVSIKNLGFLEIKAADNCELEVEKYLSIKQ